MTALAVVLGLAALAWLGVLAAPHQPHRLRERLEADPGAPSDLSMVAVLVPARDEADVIGATLAALARQGRHLEVVVVDDESADDTAEAAVRAAGPDFGVRVLAGRPLPEGWAGKLWALEQGLSAVEREYVLLLDADIELAPATVPALLRTARERSAGLVSIMAELSCVGLWERLLAPAFVFFFKLLYPFAWSNDPKRRTAAAAGGCMLVRSAVLRELGGFAAIRSALIDDCTLAAAVKRRRVPIWLGVSHSVRSTRRYATLGAFWRMVSRSAFTQLRHSAAWLLATTVLMAALVQAPVAAALAAPAFDGVMLPALGATAWLAMGAAYAPLVRFYRLPLIWTLTLPVAAGLFLAMTWTSAASYWFGSGASWKRRRYAKTLVERGGRIRDS